ncbi:MULTISPECIES: TetR/AcrR family transcriptional regulator [unclassified Sporolactobacillus]|uniref:TetR/AcrR family transcriptional regulator n=1 Tax=unclassified Sporolactobacillus TaxID=2628533 RepID=UPI0023684F0A|nr:TetR/AcrR family transcriptional regulator [Sporolactobacillus sp. CQH2019]MDD9149064.1 TetR/AcrR family transcriptional regulator [Sporolactobacillus sp. CQH2019]
MDKKQDTRDKIINAAKNLFQIKGYHATGINQIIEKSGAPKGSLYYYFPKGKEEIAIAAIENVGNSVRQDILQIMSFYDNPIDAIRAQLKHVAAKVLDTEKAEFRIGLIAFECAGSNEKIRAACEKTHRDLMSINADFLVKKGYTEERAKQTASLINILIEGAVTLSITFQDISYFTLLTEKVEVIFKNI